LKTQCDCCGTCFRNGGPPLHVEDIELVRSGYLVVDDLVTIRRGEMVLAPLAADPSPAQTNWLKIQGAEGEWRCRFLDTLSNTCTIYEHRPLSCRALRCWDTGEILAMAGHGLLCLADLMESNDPLWPLVLLQEKSCPVPDMKNIISTVIVHTERIRMLSDLTMMVENDLRIRAQAAREFNISVARELFYFGRPLFQLLVPLGIVMTQTPKGIDLQYRPC
jgi:Fe-S-cluster containining protein